MAEKNKNNLTAWMAWGPLKFAVLSLAFMVILAVLYAAVASLITNATPMGMMISMGAGFILTTCIYIYMLPRDNLDRRSFIAINTAQTITVSVAFLIAGIIFALNANTIMTRLWFMRIHQSPSFLLLATLISIFYLYLTGIFIANIYSKYRRARAMNIAPWKIIFSMPFGLSMLWIAGYALPDTDKRTGVTQFRANWYSRLIRAIESSALNTAFALALLIAVAGFFFGMQTMLITIAMGLVFAIWLRRAGSNNLRKNIHRGYASTAVALNIAILVGLILIGGTSTPSDTVQPDLRIEMSDIAPQPETTL